MFRVYSNAWYHFRADIRKNRYLKTNQLYLF